jgi:two-component system, cell cycle sensor histidine kinase and response regulator CckA
MSMNYRFSYQHITLALLATLILAGLFYLPYLSVRDKTIETFRVQQSLLAQQAGSGIQGYFSTYEKALAYLVQQSSIQHLDESGKTLLQDFFSIHPEDILGIQRLDAAGAPLFATPGKSLDGQGGAAVHCRQIQAQHKAAVSDVIHLSGDEGRMYFSAVVAPDHRFDGCLSFSLPFTRVAGRHLEQIPLHHGGYALLFSHAGYILTAPDSDLVGKSSESLHGDSDELAQLRTAIAGDEQAIVTLSHDVRTGADRLDRKFYAVVYPFEVPGSTQWSIVLLTPTREVLGAMAEFRSQWFIVTVVAIIAVGLLSLFLSGIVTRRREEQRLRAVEEQLAGLLDLAPMGVFLLAVDNTVIYANKEAEHMIAEDGEEKVIGRCFIDLLHPDSRLPVAASIRDLAAGQAISMDSLQLLRFFGNVRDVVITATPYRLGQQSQCIVIVRDVTEERRTAARQRRLAAAVDQVKEAVLIADSTGIIDYVNAALSEMTGYSREECGGQPVRMLWAREQDAHFSQKIEDVVDLGEVWRGRIVNQRKNGSLFVAAATVSPVRDAGGAVTHFVVVQRDITHEVEIESRMRQAQKMEAIGTLAGGIAHDFNNILGGIIGFTDMALLHSPPDSEIHHNLLHIRQGGKRAADLVQQILTFSRQSAMEKVPVGVAPLIKESLRLLRATLPSTIDIIQDLQADDAMVMAAPVQIQQIVMNLCANAFYSMREMGGHLTIRLDHKTRAELGKVEENGGGDWVALVVEDTGQGIEGDMLQRIFTPFFTTKEPGEGTGMGLSVVHGIVQELGGEITVQSQPGTGTVFTVLLPVVSHGLSGSLTSSEEPLPTGTEHILIVDDEQEIRETCRMMLAHLGYTVTTTGNPLEVLTLIEQAQPPVDLVITDQTMPKMTGVDLTTELRRFRPDMPVILCTGYSDRLNYDIAREAGACDLLMKPMDLRGLSTAVRSALDMTI